MAFARRCGRIVCVSVLWLCVAQAAPLSAQQQEPAQLWEDFLHYVMVARPDLASAAGTVLLETPDDGVLLDTVEASDRKDYVAILDRAEGMETVKQVAEQLRHRITKARIDRSREPQRIKAAIRQLGEGRRAYLNSVQRLRAAGQYAASHMLKTLLDRKQGKLHPFVMSATVAIGRPMVYPFSEAIDELEPVAMGQVAQVLGEIGYPTALPYLQRVRETEGIDQTAAGIVDAAFQAIVARVGEHGELGAGELFYLLGANQYDAATAKEPLQLVGFDRAENKGVVWEYTERTGLVAVPVPASIYGDVLAMRSARSALVLAPGMDSALSLWAMANLRRENSLGDQKDPSYPGSAPVASFFARLVGPDRLNDVLGRALADQDAELALDAIVALREVAQTQILANAAPLIDALTYPDRRVRYMAAFALAAARPNETFGGSYRVVPVLSQAVRQTDIRQALVVAPIQDDLNALQATLRDLDFRTIGDRTLADLSERLLAAPGVDLIVVEAPANVVKSIYSQTATDYKLAAVPILALTTPVDQIALRAEFHDDRRLFLALTEDDPDELEAAVERARRSAVGAEIGGEEATAFALTALRLLRDVALGDPAIYNVVDAQPAMTLALDDDREAVATATATVLAMINDPQAQQAIASVALDANRSDSLRLATLGSLADSATSHGNLLTDAQIENLQEKVNTSEGDEAVAAARAFGALTPSTPQAVEHILRHE